MGKQTLPDLDSPVGQAMMRDSHRAVETPRGKQEALDGAGQGPGEALNR